MRIIHCACSNVCRVPQPAEWVAKQLLSSAEDIYWKNWDSKMLGDDTTVLVVDINRPPEEELDRLSSTCCSLM